MRMPLKNDILILGPLNLNAVKHPLLFAKTPSTLFCCHMLVYLAGLVTGPDIISAFIASPF